MVDGVNKTNGINNSIYINKQDGISETAPVRYEPLPLVTDGKDNLYLFEIERENTIGFRIPPDAPQEAKDFIKALMENKEKLRGLLNIDSETYNQLAQTAVAIADVETNFNTNVRDKLYKFIRKPYKWYDQHMGMPKNHYSMGMTNMKYTVHINDKNSPEIKEQMLAMEINNEEQLEDTEKSAIATIILLNNFNKRLNGEFSEGYKKCQENFGITQADALCAIWNGGRSHALKYGNFDPQEWYYSKKARETLQSYILDTK